LSKGAAIRTSPCPTGKLRSVVAPRKTANPEKTPTPTQSQEYAVLAFDSVVTCSLTRRRKCAVRKLARAIFTNADKQRAISDEFIGMIDRLID
jgi:hypothetical protein